MVLNIQRIIFLLYNNYNNTNLYKILISQIRKRKMIIIKLKEDKQLQILIFKIICKIKIEDKLKIKILA